MTTQSSLTNNANSELPPEATWVDLAERTDHIDSRDLIEWIDESLADVEVHLRDFVTPRSLKASLGQGRS